jgi:hypothetical protein
MEAVRGSKWFSDVSWEALERGELPSPAENRVQRMLSGMKAGDTEIAAKLPEYEHSERSWFENW